MLECIGRCGGNGVLQSSLFAAVVCAGGVLGQSAQPAKELTQEQRAQKLKERDQHNVDSDRLERQGKLDEAIAAAEKMLAIERTLFEEDHEDIVGSLITLGNLHERKQSFPVAETLRKKVLDFKTSRFGDKHWETTSARLALDHLLLLKTLSSQDLGQLEKARQLHVKIIDMNQEGKFREAIPLAEEAAAIREKILKDAPDTAHSLMWLGGSLFRNKEVSAAQPHFERALAIRKKVLGEKHPDTASSHTDVVNIHESLAQAHERAGDFGAAEKHLHKVLDLQSARLGESHFLVIDARLRLERVTVQRSLDPKKRQQLAEANQWMEAAGQLRREGKTSEAVLLVRKAYALRRDTMGEKNPWVAEYASAVTMLGRSVMDQGNYPTARSLLEQSLNLRKLVLGEDHPDTAQSLYNLAVLLKNLGDVTTARQYLERALAICRKTVGEEHAYTATCLNDLGSLSSDPKQARTCLEEALTIRRKVLGPYHADTVNSLYTFGVWHSNHGDAKTAHLLLQETLTLTQKVFGEAHPNTASTLTALGTLFFRQNDYQGARGHLEKALAIRKQALGENHPDLVESLHALADVHFFLGEPAAARTYLEQALPLSQRLLDRAALHSEREHWNMSQQHAARLDGYLAMHFHEGWPAATAYAPFLAQKGAVFARQMQVRQQRGKPELAPLFDELRSVSRQFAGWGIEELEQRTEDRRIAFEEMQKLGKRREELERELALRWLRLRSNEERENPTPEKLLKVLPPGVVLIDFFVYKHRQLVQGKIQQQRHLNAFLLRSGTEIVRHNFGPIDPIEIAINKWRVNVRQKFHAAELDPGLELRRILWEPLEKHLHGSTVILISPDHALGRLPFGALPGKEAGSYLLEDFPVAIVPVPRLLPQMLANSDQRTKPSFLLVGDVDYAAAPGKPGDKDTAKERSDRAGSRKSNWRPLPGTRAEVDSLATFYKKQFGKEGIVIMRGPNATEEALRSLGGQRWLHLATHGFFAPAPAKSTLETGWDLEFYYKYKMYHLHPDLQSGLVLAGANRPPNVGEDDGIFTSMEVAELDLRETELAVLSACETGLGRIAGGEGLLGLRRAFQVAGAKTVIASLWSVPDEPTRVLMERFYANLWDRKMTKLAALRDAQLWMLREGRTHPGVQRGVERENGLLPVKAGRLPPYWWAAFELSGDWR